MRHIATRLAAAFSLPSTSGTTICSRKRPLWLAMSVALACLIVGVAPARAAVPPDQLDLSFYGQQISGGGRIAGNVNIPSITQGAPVSGQGYVTIYINGSTAFAGTFTINNLASISATAGGYSFVSTPNGFQPIPGTGQAYVTYGPPTTYVVPISLLIGAGPCAPDGAHICTTPVSTSQTLSIPCPASNAMLNFGITLSGNVSTSAMQYLDRMGGLDFVFSYSVVQAKGTLC